MIVWPRVYVSTIISIAVQSAGARDASPTLAYHDHHLRSNHFAENTYGFYITKHAWPQGTSADLDDP